MGKRQASSLRNLGMGIVALVALVALGGQLSSSAAGCFSNLTEPPGAALEVGGQTTPIDPADDPALKARGSFRVQVDPPAD
jgi:hypothetical protein